MDLFKFLNDPDPTAAPRPAVSRGSGSTTCSATPGCSWSPPSSRPRSSRSSLPSGHDLSDHMGLWTQFAAWERPAPSSDPIQKVVVYLNRFQCLRETDGPLDAVSNFFEDDEIEAQLAIHANGTRREVDGRAGTFTGIGPGWIRFVFGQVLSVASPTTSLVLAPTL